MEDEVKSSLDKAAKTYADNTKLRALILAIPYIGGSIDVLITQRGRQIYQKRIEKKRLQIF